MLLSGNEASLFPPNEIIISTSELIEDAARIQHESQEIWGIKSTCSLSLSAAVGINNEQSESSGSQQQTLMHEFPKSYFSSDTHTHTHTNTPVIIFPSGHCKYQVFLHVLTFLLPAHFTMKARPSTRSTPL